MSSRRNRRQRADSHNDSNPEMATPEFTPTYRGGVIQCPVDALIFLQACLDGRLPAILRRPHERERPGVVCSGTVVIYEQEASGITRWTDDKPWTPSRISNNCLTYRQQKQPATNRIGQDRKKAIKSANPGDDRSRGSVFGPNFTEQHAQEWGYACTRDFEKDIVSSLFQSYEFEEGGLIKKTCAVDYRGQKWHVLNYFTIEDLLAGNLQRPWDINGLEHVYPTYELMKNIKNSQPVQCHPWDMRRQLAVDFPFNSAGPEGQAAFMEFAREWSRGPWRPAGIPFFFYWRDYHSLYPLPLASPRDQQVTQQMSPEEEHSAMPQKQPAAIAQQHQLDAIPHQHAVAHQQHASPTHLTPVAVPQPGVEMIIPHRPAQDANILFPSAVSSPPEGFGQSCYNHAAGVSFPAGFGNANTNGHDMPDCSVLGDGSAVDFSGFPGLGITDSTTQWDPTIPHQFSPDTLLDPSFRFHQSTVEGDGNVVDPSLSGFGQPFDKSGAYMVQYEPQYEYSQLIKNEEGEDRHR